MGLTTEQSKTQPFLFFSVNAEGELTLAIGPEGSPRPTSPQQVLAVVGAVRMATFYVERWASELVEAFSDLERITMEALTKDLGGKSN